MKKFMKLFTISLIGLMVCGSCSCDNKGKKENASKNEIKAPVIVENTISTDREDMYLTLKNGDYRWYETTICLKYFLDEDNDGSIESVTNTFQYLIAEGNGFDTKVQNYKHTINGTVKPDPIDGFILGDCVLNDEEIKITFTQAFEKLMQANIVKPHSCYCVLREPVGPKKCNAQYIFGNIKEQVYVDAVTGEVKLENPAFESGDFGKPLGEWP